MSGLSVLLIEDNPPDVVAIQRLLKRKSSGSYQVMHAESLHDAIELIESGTSIDIVLLDLSLPDASGLESVSKMARHAPDLPVIVLTGLSDEKLAVDAVHAGAEDYLLKGELNGNLLSRSIRYAIERKRSKIELRRANVELEARVQARTAELIRLQEVSRHHQDEIAHAARQHTLGEMAAGLAHELNQPLMAIVCFCSAATQRLASKDAADPEINSLLNSISSEAKRSGEIIKRLRHMVGKRVSHRVEANLNDIVQETVGFLQHQFLHADITVNLMLAMQLPHVSVDRIQIQQVFVNLLTNAVQAIAAHHFLSEAPIIAVATTLAPRGNAIFADVSNTGPSMKPSELDRLFTPFYSTKEQGLGLGLSISRSIVESHGGTLAVHPENDSGTTFRITLPYE